MAAHIDDLDRLRDADPKQYWKLINSLKDSNNDDKTNLVEPDSWYAYFSHLNTVRDGPFNFQGGGGGYGFFSKKNILIPNVAERNIPILVEEKKNNLIQSFCHLT